MLFKTKFANQRGMTLVEILAAITILVIVFIVLLSIFPQMTKFNMQTENKLESMNLAKVELAELKRSPIRLCSQYDEKEGRETNSEYITYEEYAPEEGYVYKVDYYFKNVLYDDYDDHYKGKKYYFICDDNNVSENEEDTINLTILNKIHIKVIKDKKVISETFGYLENS